MADHIQTIVNSQKEFNSNAEEFYRDYWTESGSVKKATTDKNRAIIGKFFPEGLSGRKVLEIGVGGEGGILLQLMNSNEVHGLDVSDSAISNCLKFGISVTKANLDCDSVPFQSDSFDVVFAFEVFEHFSNPQHALEEIRRVLKPGGVFICSIPSTCTYHWPRVFYAELFEKDNFEDFLIINGFKTSSFNDWMIHNRYGKFKIPPEVKSWSWYFRSEKPDSADYRGFFEAGQHFWNKRNGLGIRTRPIEAIELFKKSIQISPESLEVKLYLAHSLLYRAINGDHEEFFKCVDEIITHLMNPAGSDKIEYLSRLLLINVEANRMGVQILSPDDYIKLKMQLSSTNGTSARIEEIAREEEISDRLSSGYADQGK